MGRSNVAALPCLVLLILCVLAPAARAQSVQPRIVGGDLTTIEKYPWQAAVVVNPAKASGSAYARQFCGGSLITPSIVLTAAHCLYDDDPDCQPGGDVDTCLPEDPEGDGSKRVDPDDIDVVLGALKLKTAPAEAEHAVEGVVIDPDFDPGSFQNDIGYLVLSAPAESSGTVQTIDLAGADEAAVWAPGTLVDVSGWGSTEYGGNTVNALRAATVPIVADSTCGSALYYGSAFDPTTMVCAGFAEGGVDSCNGDSGGPLEAPLEGGGYRLVGIVSWGFRCAEPNSPGVYTRIGQAGAGGLRDEVVATVTDLETTYALTPEEIVGSGGQPLVRPVEPPPPKTVDPTPPPEVSPAPTTAKRSSRLAKCRKLKDKRKRKKCTRRAKRTAESQ